MFEGITGRFKKIAPRFFAALVVCICTSIQIKNAHGQVPPPNHRQVFISDLKSDQDYKEDQRQKYLKVDSKPSDALDFKAPQVEFDKEKNEFHGKGGVLISQGGVQIQGDEARVNTQTREGSITGNVLMTSPDGVLGADSANLNIDTETGTFNSADFTLEDGGYEVLAGEADKISEFEFNLKDADFSTCHCLDGDRPWRMSAGTSHITQEGYAHTYNSVVWFQGLPVFYSPWMVFPAKTKRAYGLLAPQYGISSRDGFEYDQPIFLPLDDSTDVIVTPFIQTRTREGSKLELRRIFSEYSSMESKIIYSNESKRGSDLRGLDITGLSDPTIDTNRLGAYYYHTWRPDPEENLPLEFVADVHYVGDNLFLREFEDDDIGLRDATFTTSRVLGRGYLGSYATAEVSAEYNQDLIRNQDFTFQRLPEASLSGSKIFRPFGANQFGLKTVLGGSLTATEFDRDLGYEGTRYVARPRVSVPFHIVNYARGQMRVDLLSTQYDLTNRFDPHDINNPNDDTFFAEDTLSKTLPIFDNTLSTGVEKVYEVDPNGLFARTISLGASNNEGEQLLRVKHTIEPLVRYTYVPYRHQDEMPLFDSLDRYSDRSLMTYGFRTSVLGRFKQPTVRSRDIGELTPSVKDLPTIDISNALEDFTTGRILSIPSEIVRREGDIRELATLLVRQSYDFSKNTRIDELGNEIGQRPLSDISTDLIMTPSSYFGFTVGSNYNPEFDRLSSLEFGLGFKDDRDDMFRARYTYTDAGLNNIGDHVLTSQVEGNVEMKLTERLRVGYYGRFDGAESQMIESRALIRLLSACNCWHFDVGVSDRTNPDKQVVLFNFTFAGLGDIKQGIGLPQDNQNQ